MNFKCLIFGLVFLAPLILIGCKAQSNIAMDGLEFPEEKELPKELLERIIKRKESYYRILEDDGREQIKEYSKELILDKVDNGKNYMHIKRAEYWLAFNYREGIPELIKRITVDKEVGLENSADIIIMDRIENGDLKFYGHGEMVTDDLFKVSGRANYLLKVITGQNFGDVKMKSTEEELNTLQEKWINWLKKI